MSIDSVQRSVLERSRAVAIARDRFDIGAVDSDIAAAPFGVVVRDGPRACIVALGEELAILGGVLTWVDRSGLTEVALVVEHHAGVHARRAAALAPEIEVFNLSDGAISGVAPSPIKPPGPPPAGISQLISLIERCGAEVVVEDGVVRGEVAGLEVARIVVSDTGPQLEVGVGRFDREAGVLLHVGQSTDLALSEVVERVRAHRYDGAPGHPINRIDRERWLRSIVQSSPALAQITEPRNVEPIPPRRSLLDGGPAALVGSSTGTPTLVVFTVGADLGLVPSISDLMSVTNVEQVRVFAPQRDHLPYLGPLLARLPLPSELRPISVPWAV